MGPFKVQTKQSTEACWGSSILFAESAQVSQFMIASGSTEFNDTRSLFPGATVISNSMSEHGIRGTKGTPLELDIYYPDYKLGFEFQVCSRCDGIFYNVFARTHIISLRPMEVLPTRCRNIILSLIFTTSGFVDNHRYQARDKLKADQAQSLGIALVHVPFWWDGDAERYLKYMRSFILTLYAVW